MTTETAAATEVTEAPALTQERSDILDVLRERRGFLKFATKGLTDEQAALTPTVSELSLAGLIKHVARTERGWATFIVDGPAAIAGDKDFTEWDESDWAARADEFRMTAGETLAGLIAEYDEIARRTDDLVVSLPNLSTTQPLPHAPWFPANGRRSARHVFLHIAAETAHHSGHADIIRETIDGQKSMG